MDWIDAQLRELTHVATYRQVFEMDTPIASHTNVYGILRASPLADNKVPDNNVVIGLLCKVLRASHGFIIRKQLF